MFGPGPKSALPIVGFYLLYFGAIGVTLPFFPAYLKSLDLTASEVGVLLAIGPALALVGPPLWGRLADRSRRHDRVLRILATGAALGFAPLLVARAFWALFATLFLFAIFASSVTTVLDTLALRRVEAVGGSYGRLRMFGSLGFVVSSVLFGLAVDRVGLPTVAVPLGLLVAAWAWTFTLRAPPTGGSAPSTRGGFRQLAHRDLVILLAASSLHWLACAPFHGTFAIYVTALGHSPSVVGLSAALGVMAEIAIMFFYPRIFRDLAPRRVLFIAFAASAARWLLLSEARTPVSIVALSLFHGLTFGAFYVAGVAFMARRIPESLRATGQATFVSVVFGVGGLFGYLSAGIAYDLVGGARLFVIAAALELLAALVIARAPAAPPPPGRNNVEGLPSW